MVHLGQCGSSWCPESLLLCSDQHCLWGGNFHSLDCCSKMVQLVSLRSVYYIVLFYLVNVCSITNKIWFLHAVFQQWTKSGLLYILCFGSLPFITSASCLLAAAHRTINYSCSSSFRNGWFHLAAALSPAHCISVFFGSWFAPHHQQLPVV